MTDIVLEMENVYKKFKKGEIFDSLRDLIPALTGKIFNDKKSGQLNREEFWALNDVSFQIQRGEAFGIIGSNGAGKSTILKILSGIMRPTKGKMLVKGRLSALIEVGAGFHPDLTGRENIFLNGTILGMKKNEIARKFDEIVEFSGLSEFLDTPVKRYSSGMYARLGFSVAAHVDPDILIVDEVLSVGDYVFQKKCADRMKSVIKSGATIVFVSHNLRAVTELCQRTLLLDHGKASMIGPTNIVISDYLNKSLDNRQDVNEKEVYISKVSIRNSEGECISFETGTKAWIDVEVTARASISHLSIVLDVLDDNNYNIMNTSTERLGYKQLSLEAGEKNIVTFELNLHLAKGSFHISLHIYRYDIQKNYDTIQSASTFVVTNDIDIRGIANLYPSICYYFTNMDNY